MSIGLHSSGSNFRHELMFEWYSILSKPMQLAGGETLPTDEEGQFITATKIGDKYYKDIGVYSNISSSNLSVNFNRISNNHNFGVYISDGSVNASNNWWGHNNVSLGGNNCDLYFADNLNVSYEPYLVLSIYAGEYKIKNFFVI